MKGASLRVGGIVLCGGESHRMGTPKAWLPFGPEFLLQRVVRIISEVAIPVVLAARKQSRLPPVPQTTSIALDEFEDAGPLAGIAAGMALLQPHCDAAFVVGCDHPLIAPPVLHGIIELLGESEAAVPEKDGRLYPTLGVYRLSTLTALEALLRRGERRAQSFARQCRLRRVSGSELAVVDPALHLFVNINEPAEYQAALRMACLPRKE